MTFFASKKILYRVQALLNSISNNDSKGTVLYYQWKY